jgi:glycosyltransferase involved in cell wall biosynthesis
VTCEKGFVLTIIPTYNRVQLLQEAVESVLAQDHPYKRIIIVNDGSTDETESVCYRYVKEYPGAVLYQSKKNVGCAVARNHGLNLIDEDIGYVCFLDDDDRLLPGKFSREVELLKKNPEADFSYADSIIYEEETKSERLQKVAGACNPTNLAIEHFLTNEAKSAAILYRVNVVKQRRFREDLRYNEDSEFFQRIAIVCKGVYSSEPGCWVRWHAGCKSRNLIEINKAILQSSLDVINSYPSFYNADKDLIDERIKKIENDLFVELLLAGRTDNAKEYASNRMKKYFICQLGFYYRLKASFRTLLAFNK